MLYRLLIIFVIILFGFAPNPNRRKVEFHNLPYGTIPLSDSLYIDKQPIKVYDYLEFLADIRRSYSPGLRDTLHKLPIFGLNAEDLKQVYASLPMDSIYYKDMLTRIWKTVGNDKHIYEVDHRLTRSNFYHYPMVNINPRQIKEYCKWRTDKVKLNYAIQCKTLNQRKKFPINFVYRVIERKEWEKAMGIFFEDVVKIKTIKRNPVISNLASPYNTKKGKRFCYESENAAEYLKGGIITIGFNWIDEAGIGDVSYMAFEKTTDWITFRCMCEIKADTINKPIEVAATAPQKEEKQIKKKVKKEKEVSGIKSEKAKKKQKKR